MTRLFLITSIFILQSFLSFAHTKGKNNEVKTYKYICYQMGQSSAFFRFKGGDGNFGSQKGSFNGEFQNLKVDKTKKFKLLIHGDENSGGYIRIYYPTGKLMNYATILPYDKLKEMPHSTLGNKKNIDDNILWLSAFRTNYNTSAFMTFVRSTLRIKTFGNSPTSSVGFGEDYFFDCKTDK